MQINLCLLFSNHRKGRLFHIHPIGCPLASPLIFLLQIISSFSFLAFFLTSENNIFLLQIFFSFSFAVFHFLWKIYFSSPKVFLLFLRHFLLNHQIQLLPESFRLFLDLGAGRTYDIGVSINSCFYALLLYRRLWMWSVVQTSKHLKGQLRPRVTDEKSSLSHAVLWRSVVTPRA